MTIVSDCKAKENASDDDAMVVINHDVPNSPTQKCLFACFYETLGVVSLFVLFRSDHKRFDKIILRYFLFAQIKDNQMSMMSLKTLVLSKFSQDGNAITTINELIDECGVITGDDRCELAHNILECLNNGANKRGINKKQL